MQRVIFISREIIKKKQIIEVEAEILKNNLKPCSVSECTRNDDIIARVKFGYPYSYYIYYKKKDFFFDKDEAIKDANNRLEKRIASLEKQLNTYKNIVLY